MPTKTRSFIATTAAPATALFQALMADVTDIGPGKSLEHKVLEALMRYQAKDTRASCSRLNGFLHEVEAQDGKKIEHQKALQLIQQADALSATIGCSLK